MLQSNVMSSANALKPHALNQHNPLLFNVSCNWNFNGYMCIGPHPDTDNIMDPKPVEGEEQAKKRRGRKKSKLEDMFPSYLQVCNLSVLLSF